MVQEIATRHCKSCKKTIGLRNKYDYCRTCYNKSPEIKIVSRKIINNRPNFNGKNNPHYKGGLIKKICLCGKGFEVFPVRKDTAKYCSTKCKKKYSVSKQLQIAYKDIKFRSSWEVAMAKYLDHMGYNWDYEPEAFETSVGFYIPDFWVKELNIYIEVKGFFRDDSKIKFEEFSTTHPAVLANLEYFKSLGFERVKSGPLKGQLCHSFLTL